MAWKLRVFMSGLFVVIDNPSDESQEVVFVNTGTKKDAHQCTLQLVGNVSGPAQPFTPVTHDIRIYDGANEITKSVGPPTGTMSGLPMLRKIPNACTKPLHGVLRPAFPSDDSLWSCRVGLYGGSIEERDPSKYEWYVTYGNPPTTVDGPKLISQELLYELDITSDTARIAAIDRNSNAETWTIKPVNHMGTPGDNAEITICNRSIIDPVLGPNGDAPHFPLAFTLFDPGPVGELRVNGPTAPQVVRTSMSSVHIPCVGGCTC